MKKIPLVISVVFALSSTCFAQCPDSTVQIPQLHGVLVRATVSQNPSTTIFTYQYSILHDSLSVGCIDEFQIDIVNPPGRSVLSSSGLIDYPRYVVRNFGATTGVTLIPVGVPTLPSYNGIPSAWGAIVSNKGYISWGSAFNEADLPPGAQLSNLVLTSYGLPGVRTYVIKPVYNPPPVEEGQVTGGSFDTLQIVEDSIKRVGVTIGPTAPVSPFNSLNFLDTIKSYINQSRSLGWISDSTTKYKYLNFMDSAKAQLQRNDNRTGRATLDSATANCQRDSGSVLTSEAYALIFFNVKYLLAQLPVPPPQYKLKITIVGSGSIVKIPDQIFSLYDSATIVTLTARPAPHNRFAGWTGDVTAPDTQISVTMNQITSVTATFKRTYQVTVQTNPAGRIDSVDGIAYTSTQVITWDSAATHRLGTFTPQSGGSGIRYVLVNWSDGGNAVHSVSARSDTTFTVNFNKQYQITVQPNPTGRTFSIDGTNYTTSQTNWWNSGISHAIGTTTPQTATGTIYDFQSWSDAGAMTHTVTPAGPTTYTVTFFTRYLLTVNVNPSEGGTTSPSGATYQFRGQSIPVYEYPNCNTYHFVNWSGDTSGTNTSFNITMYGPKTYTANFASGMTSYTLNLTSSGNGSASASPSLPCYAPNSLVTLTASPSKGYQFLGWSGDAGGTAYIITVTMNANKSIQANFSGIVPQSPVKK